MDLDNLVDVVVHYLLIGEITYLGRWDESSHGECTSVHGYTLNRT